MAGDLVHCHVKPCLCACISESNKDSGILNMNKGHTEISVSVNMESFDSIVTYEQDVLHCF